LRLLLLTFVLLAALFTTACGDGDESSPTPSPPSSTASPAGSPTRAGTTGTPTPIATLGLATPEGPPRATLPLGKISFSSRRDILGEVYLLTAEDEINLSNDPDEDMESDISPDGKKVVFSSNREEIYHLYVVNVDGSGLTRITSDAAGDFSPRWSPDGKRIAFSRAGSLFVMDAGGGDVQQITEAEPEQTAPACKAGAFLGGWSPDGTQLTFYAASVTRQWGQICTINTDGSNLQLVVGDESGWHVEPSWSPDGEWIAYRFIDGENYEIYIVRPDGSDNTNLTNDPAAEVEPDWSPDGEWVVFASSRSGAFDLYMIRPDGTGAARLTTSGAKDSDPSWGP
jgi:TolB protein